MRALVFVLAVAFVACGSDSGGRSERSGASSSTSAGGGGSGGAPVGVGGTAGEGGGGFNSGECKLGETQSCYGGEADLAGVGICSLGEQSCVLDGEFLVWGPCAGWVGPEEELCDTIDSDCDGDLEDADCPLACDGVSPAFGDPFQDGSLRLKGKETAGFDAPLVKHSWICTQDTARINVCDSTTIELAGGAPTIVGGGGIGPLGAKDVHITVKSNASEPIWILLDASHAPITLELVTPLAPVTVTSKGPHMVFFGGTAGDINVQTEAGLTVSIPVFSTGNVEMTAGGGPLVAPGGCP
jgi:hypothetical protein